MRRRGEEEKRRRGEEEKAKSKGFEYDQRFRGKIRRIILRYNVSHNGRASPYCVCCVYERQECTRVQLCSVFFHSHCSRTRV